MTHGYINDGHHPSLSKLSKHFAAVTFIQSINKGSGYSEQEILHHYLNFSMKISWVPQICSSTSHQYLITSSAFFLLLQTNKQYNGSTISFIRWGLNFSIKISWVPQICSSTSHQYFTGSSAIPSYKRYWHFHLIHKMRF